MTAARFLRPTLPQLWAFLAVALPTLGALVAPMPAVDLAYQIRAGGQMLDGLGIPTSDTWTFTIAGQPWADQHWWAQLALAAVYRATGWDGLAILRAVLVATIFGLLFLVVRSRAPRLTARTSSLLVLAAFVVASPTLALRPQLFAMVLFVATLLVLADRANHPRRVWLIPIFALLWANLHGTFPLVIVLAGLAWLADLSGSRARQGALRPPFTWRRLTMLGVTVVAALATLVNPLGLDVWTYVVRLATNPTIGARVSEWRPPGLSDASGLLFWGSVVAVVASLAFLARRRRAAARPTLLPWPALLTLAVFAALGAVTGRGLAWWPLAAVFVLAGFIEPRAVDAEAEAVTNADAAAVPTAAAPTAIAGGGTASREPRGSRLNALVGGVLTAAGIALLPFWRPVGPAGVPNGLLSYAPQGIAAQLEALGTPCDPESTLVESQSPPRVFNPQIWGSWLEFTVPCNLFTVDSRIELYPASVWADYDTIENAGPAWRDVLTRWDVDVIVVARDDHALGLALVLGGGWGLYYSDADGSIWYRYVKSPPP